MFVFWPYELLQVCVGIRCGVLGGGCICGAVSCGAVSCEAVCCCLDTHLSSKNKLPNSKLSDHNHHGNARQKPTTASTISAEPRAIRMSTV